MSRFLSAVPVLLAVVATSPIHAGQSAAVARVPDAPAPVPAIKVAPERLRAATIYGNALDSANGQLPNAPVRLRDARFGRIIDTQYTDTAGLFEFARLEPGTYIVEILGDDQSILAASQLININAGDSVTAIVKLPFKVPPFAQIMGATSNRAATILLLNAAAAGITALVPTAPISPNR